NLVGAAVYLAVGRLPGPAVGSDAGAPEARPAVEAARLIERLYRGGSEAGTSPAWGESPPEPPAGGGQALELCGLRKHFGATIALDGIDLEVPAGSIFGFLGPNGAGKTTALRILTGLARPTAGCARIFDREDPGARRLIGYLPDVPGFYPWMTAAEFLELSGRLHGLGGAELEERVSALLDWMALGAVRGRIGSFSRGMKQRLGIAQALVHAPALLLLDEPTSALDPIGRREVLDAVALLRGHTTVFFSSHILADVERVCDTVAVLDRGRIVARASVAELRSRGRPRRLRIEVRAEAERLVAGLKGAPWLTGIRREGSRLEIEVRDPERAEREIPRALAAAGLGLVRLEAVEPTLEDVFLELVGGKRS
ncbi:MAG: ABC transporter ATP-binding protein, partial [Planctomycetes bacterium]|nr:ABC transporter ATP-binding protein [Planctomycetota bacterium]